MSKERERSRRARRRQRDSEYMIGWQVRTCRQYLDVLSGSSQQTPLNRQHRHATITNRAVSITRLGHKRQQLHESKTMAPRQGPQKWLKGFRWAQVCGLLPPSALCLAISRALTAALTFRHSAEEHNNFRFFRNLMANRQLTL